MNLFSHPSLGYPIFHSIDKALPERLRNRKSSNLQDPSTIHTSLSIAFSPPILEATPVSDRAKSSKDVKPNYCFTSWAYHRCLPVSQFFVHFSIYDASSPSILLTVPHFKTTMHS
jgi:hypothetical protein